MRQRALRLPSIQVKVGRTLEDLPGRIGFLLEPGDDLDCVTAHDPRVRPVEGYGTEAIEAAEHVEGVGAAR